MTFSCGLLHGLGFAGALADVGLPQEATLLALFMFNIGVELGQIAFVVVVLTCIWMARFTPARIPRATLAAASYGIGAVAAFWTIERIAGSFE